MAEVTKPALHPVTTLDDLANGLPADISLDAAYGTLLSAALQNPNLLHSRGLAGDISARLRTFAEGLRDRPAEELLAQTAQACLKFVEGALARRTVNCKTLEIRASVHYGQAASIYELAAEIPELSFETREAAAVVKRSMRDFCERASNVLAEMTMPFRPRLAADDFKILEPCLQEAAQGLRMILEASTFRAAPAAKTTQAA